MAKMVGLSRAIKIEWLNKVVSLVNEGMAPENIKEALNDYISFEITSPDNIRKTREILMNLWVYPFADEGANEIRKSALQAIRDGSEDRLAMHWCMMLLAYGSIIINFPTKAHYAHPSKLVWIEQGLQNFVDTYKEQGIASVAFPKLGCSNGGLRWSDVLPIMEKYLSPLDIDVYICEATKREAEGAELEMVTAYNDFISGRKIVDIKLNDKQMTALVNNGRINHFYELASIEGIKGAPYKRLFNTFFPKDDCQLSIPGF